MYGSIFVKGALSIVDIGFYEHVKGLVHMEFLARLFFKTEEVLSPPARRRRRRLRLRPVKF